MRRFVTLARPALFFRFLWVAGLRLFEGHSCGVLQLWFLLIVGQPFAIALQPRIFGISLNYAQIGQIEQSRRPMARARQQPLAPTPMASSTLLASDADDCQCCSHHRQTLRLLELNSAGGAADFTTRTPNNKTGESSW